MPSPAEVEQRVVELWDFADPAATAERFRQAADAAGDPAEAAVLRTQQARALGLAGDFPTADRVLDGVDPTHVEGDGGRHARARVAIERGRVRNSTGDPEAAAPFFVAAYDLASACGAGGLAVDALHMSAIAAGAVGGPDAARVWDERALAEVEASADPLATAWLGTILNNLGWDLHDGGQLTEALDAFERAVQVRIDAGQHDRLAVARWCAARALRSLGRHQEALAVLHELAADPANAGDGYVPQEIAANLTALGRPDEAAPYAERSAELLGEPAAG